MNYLDGLLFEPLTVCGHGLPSTWRYMLPREFALLKLPKESLATCDNCPMVAIGAYSAKVRCCTHFAQIPNFQLGLSLKDPSSRELARAVIQKGYALPDGTDITPTHYLTTASAYEAGLFGKSEALLCPFAADDTGNCGIYPFRSAVCATFHCGRDHCEAGSAYWGIMENLVGQVETALSQWAMGKAGLDVCAYIERRNQLAGGVATLSGENTKSWSISVRQHLFGDFFGREEAFFEACADHIATHREELWQIACAQPVLTADEYDSAVEQLVASAAPDENLPGAHSYSNAEPTSIETLWRVLEAATAALWSLPLDTGTVALSNRITIEANPMNDPVSRLYENKSFRLICPTSGDIDDTDDDEDLEALPSEVFLTAAEREALRLFESPRTIDQFLLDTPELSALENPKDFLAECLRCGILCKSDEI